MKLFSTAKLAALSLCSILLMGTMVGCTGADVQKAVSQVAGEMPAVESAVAAAADLTAAADPALAPIVLPINVIAQSALPQLQALLKEYSANPNASVFASISSVIDSIVVNGDAALLSAAKIKDTASQQKATAILASLDALLHVVDGFVSQAQTTAQVQAKVAARNVKLAEVAQYWSPADKAGISAAMHAPFPAVMAGAQKAGY